MRIWRICDWDLEVSEEALWEDHPSGRSADRQSHAAGLPESAGQELAQDVGQDPAMDVVGFLGGRGGSGQPGFAAGEQRRRLSMPCAQAPQVRFYRILGACGSVQLCRLDPRESHQRQAWVQA